MSFWGSHIPFPLAAQLYVVRRVGLGQGLGIYRQAERIGNVLAPIITGVLIAGVGYAKSLAVIGGYTVISSLLFLFISGKRSTYRLVLSEDEAVLCKIGEREVKLLDLSAGGLSFKNIGLALGESFAVQFSLPGMDRVVSAVVEVQNIEITKTDQQQICHCRLKEIGAEDREAIHQYILKH